MHHPVRWLLNRTRAAAWAGAGLGLLLQARPAAAQDLPRVSVNRELIVGGVETDAHVSDLLGLSRIKFQGLIASELSAIGYRLQDPSAAAGPTQLQPDLPPLTLVGEVKEELCDDEAPSQCRIAIRWELQDPRGVVVYRALTRAVGQEPTLEKLRRSLLEGALRSLLQRRRFALQFTSAAPQPAAGDTTPLRYVRDRDDPPYALSKRYTYGTSTTAHRVRKAGLVTAGAGAVLVAGTWFAYRGAMNPSPAAHNRFVVLNYVGWAVLGLGVAGFGVSYALPESHDVVEVRSAARPRLFVGLGVGGLELGGRI